MNTRNFALVLGIVFVLVAIMGFLQIGVFPEHTHPAMVVHTEEGRLIALFPVNVLHDLVHLLFGVWGILAFFGGASASILYSRVVCVAYLALAVLAILPVGMFQTVFGLIPIHSHDIWLHGLIGLAAGYFGFVLTGQTPRPAME